MKRLLVSVGILVIPLAWYIASEVAGSYVIPAPWTTIGDTISLFGEWDTWRTILITSGRVVFGFAIALTLGAVVGIATVRSAIEYLLRPTILLMQGVPPILWSIPLILIMGFSRFTPVLVIALICFPLVATNLSEGMRTVPKDLKEMLDIFAPGFLPRLRELILPHLKPFFAAAIRLGIGLGIKASVIAEYFAANDGIGFQVQTAYQAFLVRKLFSWALILILLILAADFGVRRLSRYLQTLPGPRNRLPNPVPQESIEGIRRRFRSPEGTGALVLSGVSFGYRKDLTLLSKIDLKVEPGQIAVLSGDSGSGKTTLLKLISGMVTPLEGSVHSPAHLGLMFQDDRYLPWMNNLGNTAMALYYREYSWPQAQAFAGLLLEQVGLGGQELKFPGELSGGMKKRLAFARSFACLPGALLLDEPFTGLQHLARAELWREFTTLIAKRPVPVLVITHFPEEVPAGPKTALYTLSGSPARLSRR